MHLTFAPPLPLSTRAPRRVHRCTLSACVTPPERHRPHHITSPDLINSENPPEEIPMELADGHVDNLEPRPKIDLDADELMLMIKLRRMLHADDFKRIFHRDAVGDL